MGDGRRKPGRWQSVHVTPEVGVVGDQEFDYVKDYVAYDEALEGVVEESFSVCEASDAGTALCAFRGV